MAIVKDVPHPDDVSVIVSSVGESAVRRARMSDSCTGIFFFGDVQVNKNGNATMFGGGKMEYRLEPWKLEAKKTLDRNCKY